MEEFLFEKPKKRKRKLSRWISNFKHPLSSHKRIILSHSLNKKIEIFVLYPISDNGNDPPPIPELKLPLQNAKYYKSTIPTLQSLFIDDTFFHTHLQSKSFLMIPTALKLDCHDTFAISQGTLFLSLAKDTYEQFGLQGTPSLFKPLKNSFYFVKLSLTDLNKYCSTFKILCKSLKRFFLNVSVLFCDKNEIILPPNNTKNLQFTEFNTKKRIFDSKTVQFPTKICLSNSYECLDYVNLIGILKYQFISMESIDRKCLYKLEARNNRSLDFADYYCKRGTVEGIFDSSLVHKVVEELKSKVESSAGEEIVVVNVKGFENSPVSWGDKEHGYWMDGDLGYSVVMMGNGNYVMNLVTSDLDFCVQ